MDYEFLFHFIVIVHLVFYRTKSKLFYFLSLCLLFSLAAFRGLKVGTDTENYYIFFVRLTYGNLESGYELFWEYLNRIILFAGGEFQVVLWISSALTLIPIYLGAKKVSLLPVYSIFIYLTFYYYFYSFNIMRQCLAVSIIFTVYILYNYSFKYKNWLLFSLIITACLFHKSSLIVLPVIFLIEFLKKGKNEYLIVFSSLGLGILLGNVIFRFSTLLFAEYSDISARSGMSSNLINIMILNAAYYFVSKSTVIKDFWYRIFVVFIIFSNLLIMIPYSNRIMMYVGIGLIVFFPNFLKNNNIEVKAKPLVFILISFYALFRYSRIFGGGDLFPYENILFGF